MEVKILEFRKMIKILKNAFLSDNLQKCIFNDWNNFCEIKKRIFL